MVNISQPSTLFDIDKNICSVYYINKQECAGAVYYERERVLSGTDRGNDSENRQQQCA